MSDTAYVEPLREDGEDIRAWRGRVLRARLDTIDGWLAEGWASGEMLADVLSALRGPDDEDDQIKSSSTAFIRSKAFPNTRGASDSIVFSLWSFSCRGDTIRVFNEDGRDHFNDHIRRAARYLDLEVIEEERRYDQGLDT